jgi:hypothetical protein
VWRASRTNIVSLLTPRLGRIMTAIYVSNIPPRHLSEASAALGRYERRMIRMLFPSLAFYEQSGFLNGLCADPGSNTPA